MNDNIFFFFYNLAHKSELFDQIVIFFADVFPYFLIFALLVWAIFLSKKKMMTFSILFLTGISAFVLARIFKIIFHTARPYVEMNVVPFFYETSFSFPSEHTAVFTALAVCIFLVNKKLGIILSVLAVLIGLSRIISGVHYPIDILAGAILGFVVGFLYLKLFKKLI